MPEWRTRRPLPERVLSELRRGPSSGVELAERLGAKPAAVAGALSSLRRRSLVYVAGTQRGRGNAPRVLYELVEAARWAPEPLDEPPPQEHPGGDILDRLGQELELLRFERDFAAGADTLSTMAGNRGLQAT